MCTKINYYCCLFVQSETVGYGGSRRPAVVLDRPQENNGDGGDERPVRTEPVTGDDHDGGNRHHGDRNSGSSDTSSRKSSTDGNDNAITPWHRSVLILFEVGDTD